MDETPVDATHTRDGDYYKVTDKVQFFAFGKWNDCKHAHDVEDWLDELTPISSGA